MAKIELGGLGSGYASTAKLNEQLQKIQDELNNKVLYRDNPNGEVNSLSNDLDMNSNQVLNVAFGDNPTGLVPKSYVDSEGVSRLEEAKTYTDNQLLSYDPQQYIDYGLVTSAVANTLDYGSI
jgi:hypothetical protein